MAATISLLELANLSIGHPEPGVVNFAALHALLHAVLQHLGIQHVQTEHVAEVGPAPAPSPSPAPWTGPGTDTPAMSAPYLRLERKVRDVEQQVQELSRLPNAMELLQRSRHDGRAMSDVWNLLQLRKSTDLNREGVDKAMSMMEEVMQEMNYLKKFKNTMEDHVKDITRNIDLVTTQMNSVNEVLNKPREEVEQFVPWKTLQTTLVDPPTDRYGLRSTSPVSTAGAQSLSGHVVGSANEPLSTGQTVSPDGLPQQPPTSPQEPPTSPQHPPAGLQHPPAGLQRLSPSPGMAPTGDNYPEAVSALKRIRQAADNQPVLDRRVSALEKAVADLASLTMDGDETQEDDRSERLKSPGAVDDVQTQITDLRVMVKNIDEELNELRRLQPSSATPGGPVQQQLDKLGSVLEKIMSSSCALLGMSLGLDTEPTCPVCSLDVSQDASNLCQRFQRLQETVAALTEPSGEGVKLPEGVVEAQVQSRIQQLQGECEKLNGTTDRLLQEHEEHQRNLQSLFDSLNRLETKCGDGNISRLQLDAVTDQINRMLQGLLNKICSQEKDWNCVLERLTTEMECKLDRIELDPLKKQLEDRWRSVRKLLQSQRGSEAEGAAGLRKQLISHFHCLSCDRPLDIKVPCAPNVVSLPLSTYPVNMLGAPRSDIDPARRRGKGERIAELLDTYPSAARSCGGSHTLTYARRCPRLYDSYPLTPDQDLPKRDESAVMSCETQGTKGRSSCRLPSIAGRDGARCKPPRCPSQKSSSSRLCPSRLANAHLPTVLGSGPAPVDRGHPLADRDCLCGVPAPPCPCPSIGGSVTAPLPQSLSGPTPDPGPLEPLVPPDIPPHMAPVNI